MSVVKTGSWRKTGQFRNSQRRAFKNWANWDKGYRQSYDTQDKTILQEAYSEVSPERCTLHLQHSTFPKGFFFLKEFWTDHDIWHEYTTYQVLQNEPIKGFCVHIGFWPGEYHPQALFSSLEFNSKLLSHCHIGD